MNRNIIELIYFWLSNFYRRFRFFDEKKIISDNDGFQRGFPDRKLTIFPTLWYKCWYVLKNGVLMDLGWISTWNDQSWGSSLIVEAKLLVVGCCSARFSYRTNGNEIIYIDIFQIILDEKQVIEKNSFWNLFYPPVRFTLTKTIYFFVKSNRVSEDKAIYAHRGTSCLLIYRARKNTALGKNSASKLCCRI